jgi:hypothetical protein
MGGNILHLFTKDLAKNRDYSVVPCKALYLQGTHVAGRAATALGPCNQVSIGSSSDYHPEIYKELPKFTAYSTYVLQALCS